MMQSKLTSALPATIHPEIMGGVPVFSGTRVPIQTLFDYLLDGCTLEEFLDNFPSVSENAARATLAYAAQKVTNGISAA
jgi:uncharacterized protein (DUF433 family)